MDSFLLQAGIGEERCNGVVSQWTERGYGFIHFTDGRRAYVHNSQCGGQHLTQGEPVSAIVMEDSKNPGKLAAMHVLRQAPPAEQPQRPQHQQTDHLLMEQPPQPPQPPRPPPQPSESPKPVSAYKDPTQALVAALARAAPRPRTQHSAVQSAMQSGPPLAATSTAMTSAAMYGDPTPPARLEGTVTQWNERGFGFIEFTDGRRAYVHSINCGGEHLVQGEIVNAEVVDDYKTPGKFTAQNVRRGVMGEDGTVTEWSDAGGYGFLQMDDAKRAYVHRSALGGALGLTVGQRLRVILKPDSRNPGKWMVHDVKGELQPLQADDMRLQRHSVQRQQYVAPADHAELAVQAGIGGEDGTVVEWHEDGGYGFLTMDDQRRVYVHRSFFGGIPGHGSLRVGQRLRVATRPDARNAGKWCVAEVFGELTDPTQPPPPPAPAVGQNSTGEDGTVHEWHEDGGYGFLNMDDGRRVYVHRSHLGGGVTLLAGQRLRITTKPDTRNAGKWSVAEVISGLEASLSRDAQPSKRPRVV